MSICTLTGRIRRNVKLPVFNNTAYSGLAADGAKLALWNLTYVGFKYVTIYLMKNWSNLYLFCKQSGGIHSR